MRKFVFKALAFLSTDVLASAIGLFSLLILTNNMSKNSFGFFVLMLGIVVFIESLTNLQSWQGIVKFGSEDIKRVNRLYLSLNVAKAIYLDFIGSIFATLLALLTFVILFYVRNQYLTGFNVLEISLATLFFLWRFNGTATGLLRLSQDYQLINSRALLVSLLRFSSVFVILNFNQLDAIKLFFIYGCIEFIATLYFHVLVYYRMKTKVIGFKYLFVHKIKKDSFTRFCLYSSWSSVFSTSMKQIDILIVGFIGGDVSAGVFKVLKQISTVFGMLSNPILIMVFPEFSKKIANGEKDKVIAIIDSAFPKLFFLFSGLCFVFFFVSENVLLLFGTHYGEYKIELFLFVSIKCFSLIFCLYHPFLISIGKVKEIAIVNTYNSILFVSLSIIMTQKYGLMGFVVSYFLYVLVDCFSRYVMYCFEKKQNNL